MMVSTTERNAGAGAGVCTAGCAGELVALRPGTCDSWAALAGLDALVDDGPATGEEEVDTCTCVSFAGTLSRRGGDAAVVEVEGCGGECSAAGTFSLIFPFDWRGGSLETYCGTVYGAGRSAISFAKYSCRSDQSLTSDWGT